MRGPDPTHWKPLWAKIDDDGETYYLDAAAGVTDPVMAIPAERVTVTPEPYTPKVGDRVPTNLGYDVTILAAEPLQRYIPVRFHTPDGDTYGKIHVDRIDQAIQ